MNPNVRIMVDARACTSCRACYESCPATVFRMEKDKGSVAHRPDWCIECGHCVLVCPAAAIDHRTLPSEDRPDTIGARFTAEGILSAVRERRTVRRFTEEEIEGREIEGLLLAGRYAPTGVNRQNVGYSVVLGRARMDRLQRMTHQFYRRLLTWLDNPVGRRILPLAAGRELAGDLIEGLPKARVALAEIRQGRDRLFYQAPAMIVAHAPAWDTCSPFNCCAAMFSISLYAHAKGYGCCFNGYFEAACLRSARIRREIEVPRGSRVYSAMLIGRPAERFSGAATRRPVRVRWIR